MELDTNTHSVFSLNYHLILVINRGNTILTESLSERLQKIFKDISKNYNLTLIKWESYSNYIHIMFSAHPNSELSKFINAYKSASSRLIKKDFPKIKNSLNNNIFWSRSFCLLTEGKISRDTIEKYIKSQANQCK